MERRYRKQRDETWEETRARIIGETEAFLNEALRYPELATRIPTIQAGTGHFPRSLARAFWDRVLVE